MKKLVFRKALWEQAMLEAGYSEQDMEKYAWPDEIDNLEVEHMTIGWYTILPKWCEIVNVERKCKK